MSHQKRCHDKFFMILQITMYIMYSVVHSLIFLPRGSFMNSTSLKRTTWLCVGSIIDRNCAYRNEPGMFLLSSSLRGRLFVKIIHTFCALGCPPLFLSSGLNSMKDIAIALPYELHQDELHAPVLLGSWYIHINYSDPNAKIRPLCA